MIEGMIAAAMTAGTTEADAEETRISAEAAALNAGRGTTVGETPNVEGTKGGRYLSLWLWWWN